MSDGIKASSDNSRKARFVRSAGGWFLPALISGLLHGAAVLMLWGGWWQEPQLNTPSSRVQTQLMTLTYQVAEPAPPVALPPVAPQPVIEPELLVDQAVIARKRLEEQREQEQQEREEKQRREEIREEQLVEKKRQEEQELARQQAQDEQRAQEEQRARDEQQRLAAEARARAEGEAEVARREAEAIAQYQPINKEPPAYPRRALDSKIEGDCTVSYTVTPDGRVSKPQVIESACDDPIFIRPSLQAASAFRYQPRIVNGRAVAVHDVRNTFRYRIQ